MSQIQFIPFNEKSSAQQEDFFHLAKNYYIELESHNAEQKTYPDQSYRDVCREINEDVKQYKAWLYLSYCGGIPMGFVMAQIDEQNNPWHLKLGYGFIREFFIEKEFRNNGYGRQLATFIEKVLQDAGAQNIYLTADPITGIPFWEKVGYEFSGEICEQNDEKIYLKKL